MADPLPPALAARVWCVLVEECGCRDDPRDAWAFAHYVGEPLWCGHEWRFQGALGFGGKFYNDGRKWWVSCYPEDETPERMAMIARANARRAGRDMIGMVEWRDRHGRVGRVAASLGNADMQAHLQQAEREGVKIEREDRDG